MLMVLLIFGLMLIMIDSHWGLMMYLVHLRISEPVDVDLQAEVLVRVMSGWSLVMGGGG